MSASVLRCICSTETFEGFEDLWPEGNTTVSHSASLQTTDPRFSLHDFCTKRNNLW